MKKKYLVLCLIAIVAVYALYSMWPRPEPPEWRLVKSFTISKQNWTYGPRTGDPKTWYLTLSTERFNVSDKWRFTVVAEQKILGQQEGGYVVEHRLLAIQLIWISGANTWVAWERTQTTNWTPQVISMNTGGTFCFTLVSQQNFWTYGPEVTITVEEFR